MTNLSTLTITIDAETAKYIEELKRADNKTKDFGRSISKQAEAARTSFKKVAAGAAVLGAAVAGLTFRTLRQGIERLDRLGNTADKLGLTTSALAGLRLAAESTGVAANTLDLGIQRMTRRIAEAAQGTGEAKAAIQELGLSAEALARLPVEQQFAAIAERMAQVQSQSDRVRLGFKLFDSEGVSLINTLRLGSDGLRSFEERAGALGTAVNRLDVAKVQQAKNAFTEVTAAVEGAGNKLTVALAPIATDVANRIVEMSLSAGDFSDEVGKATQKAIVGFGLIRNGIIAVVNIVRTAQVAILELGEGAAQIGESFSRVILRQEVNPFQDLVEYASEASRQIQQTIANDLRDVQTFDQLKQTAREYIDTVNEAAAKQAELTSTQATSGLPTGDGAGSVAGPSNEELRARLQQQTDIKLSALRVEQNQIAALEQEFAAAQAEGRQIADEMLLEQARVNAVALVQARFAAEQAAKGELGLALTEEEAAARELELIAATNEEKLRLYEQYYNQKTQVEAQAANEAIRQAQREAAEKNKQRDIQFKGAQFFFAKNKTLSRAAALFEQKDAIVSATRSTLAGMAKALELGWPLGPIAAAAIGAAGFGYVASIAGLGGGGGGAAGSAPGAPSSLPERSFANEEQQEQPRQASTVQIIFQGDTYGWDEYVQEKVVQGVRDAVKDKDLILIDNDSRNGQNLTSAVT